MAELGRRGLLGPDVTLCHCTRLSAADFDAIAASSTAVALTPASDMARGDGPPPMQQLIDRGIRPGLGVGDQQLAPGDVFAQMRAVISVQHATMFDLKLAGKGALPNLLGTRDVIRYATIDGARVAGLSGITGSLSPGKRADVIVLRADRPNIAPVNDPIGAVVWGMDTSNIDWVFVGGASLVAHGELSADVARARALAVAAQRQIEAAAGVPAGAGAAHVSTAMPSAAVTRFVVASRYMPAYLALGLLVVVAAIWVPETLSPVALSAIAPFAALLAITALGQMLVIMTGGIDLSTPGTLTLAAMIVAGVGKQSDSRIWIAILTAVGRRCRHRVGERDPHRRSQAERADRHPRHGPDRDRDRQPLRDHVPDPERRAGRPVRLGVQPVPGRQPDLLDRAWPSPWR